MIIFKTAKLTDAESISNLVNSAYRGDSSKKGWTTEADLLDGLRTNTQNIEDIILSKNNQIEMMIDLETNKLVASVHLKHEDNQTLYFGMLTVEPLAQAQGHGKKLLKHIEDYASQNNFHNLRISVIHLRPELISFYERRGFMATGKSEPFPENDPLSGIPKVSGLKLLEFIKKLS